MCNIRGTVNPHLDYGAQGWLFMFKKDAFKVEQMQTKTARTIKEVPFMRGNKELSLFSLKYAC